MYGYPMLATFNGTWDWTALGTLTLAIVTGISLAFAWGSLKQTQRQIKLGQEQLEQTQREIELSRREVEEAHRPVVMPLADYRLMDFMRFGRPVSAKPWAETNMLYIPIENVGPGPALGIQVAAKLLSSAGDWSGTAGGEHPGVAAALGTSSRIAVCIGIPGLASLTGFSLTVTYRDVAGKEWLTDARYVLDLDRYTDLTLSSQEDGANRPRQDAESVKPAIS
jgi:hypothetical protein